MSHRVVRIERNTFSDFSSYENYEMNVFFISQIHAKCVNAGQFDY